MEHARNAPDGGLVNAGRRAPRLPINEGVKPEHWGEDEPDMPLLRGVPRELTDLEKKVLAERIG